ncbi:olfactory receptor 1052 [Chelonia mydas]|uniref:olfactory receptor 1052 n=1 Tax=Chelonia mydas TaxID=8469 RepID=UPI0018A23D99|nr:olfactory receptor 1052 [Chelonia mydas]
MAQGNDTTVTEFILAGFTDHPELQVALFLIFLVIYVLTLLGNFGMIALIWTDSRFHTPMYLLLSNLSLVDLGYSSSIAPRVLVSLSRESKAISYAGCAAQLYFFATFATTESFLLAVMAYDRYVAICNPLLYTVTISKRSCVWLLASSYMAGVANATVFTSCTFQLSFCGPNVIDHYVCDVIPLMRLSCTDTHTNEMLLSIFTGSIQLTTMLIILFSYLYITAAILRICSSEGRHKAFSTCTSHLTAVAICYGTTCFIYLKPSSTSSLERDQVISVFYTVVIPMLNPLIYSLRNKEVKDAVGRMLERRKFSQQLR